MKPTLFSVASWKMISIIPDNSCFSFHSQFLPPLHISANSNHTWYYGDSLRLKPRRSTSFALITCTSNPLKIRRDPSLDKHVVKHNKIRFVQKLRTLLLSKPRHFMPLHVLNKCRSYLSFPKPRSILSMVHRYPTVFEVFTIRTPPLPLNATRPLNQLCIRLTSEAAELASKESELKKAMSDVLAVKLQKLLMLATHHRLLLYKLVHLAPDLGLPINFHSWLCYKYPERFKVVQTSYGHALELVTWDIDLANGLPKREAAALDLIMDRPLKFKHLRLRKGLNIKKRHQEFLLKFEELPDVCPYRTKADDLTKESLEAEKRACAVVREVLGMTMEKRTLVDHLTHFRKDFGLPNKLRGMLVRHPELFYVSLKGQRDSVFLVEGYDERGVLREKDGMLVIRDQLLKLVNKGHKMRKEKRNGYLVEQQNHCDLDDNDDDDDDDDGDDGDYVDSLDDLFELEDFPFVDDANDGERTEMQGLFWTSNAISSVENDSEDLEPW